MIRKFFEEGNGGATPRKQNGRRWTVVANQVWLKTGGSEERWRKTDW